MLNYAKIVLQIGLLFVFYSIGLWIRRYFDSFIPGSVIGLILMFLFLSTGLLKTRWIERGARFMVDHLVLFFIPATVGILTYYGLFKGKGMLLIVITIVSTLLVMASSGAVSQMLARERDVSNE